MKCLSPLPLLFTTMIELRPATADDMVLAFLRADIETPATDRRKVYADALTTIGAERAALIGDHADPANQQQNDARRALLGVRGYGLNLALFSRFPADTSWRLVKVTSNEVKGFHYVNHLENWARISGGTRRVAEGVKNIDQAGNEEIKGNVTSIARRLRQELNPFPALIAAQCTSCARWSCGRT